MGKPSDHGKPYADNLSLHDTPNQGSSSSIPYVDDDAPEIDIEETARNIADLPPLYSDAVESTEADPMLAPTMAESILPIDVGASILTDKDTGAQSWVAQSVSDPKYLKFYITQLANVPPRPFIKILGTHTETTRDSKGKTEKNTVTDFDVMVDLTPYLYANAQYRQAWNTIWTVENLERVRRGTVLRKTAVGKHQEVEAGETKPTLTEWCHRFTASAAPLKCFTLERRVTGFDWENMQQRLTELVRRTNYRGRLQVDFVVKDARIDFYNDVKINRWRLVKWIRMLFYITFLFIFVWPYLYFRTKRWEVVRIEWPFSRVNGSGRKEYVSLNEEQLYNLWGQAISKAVMQKKQTVLDQTDLRAAHEAEPAFNTGDTRVDGALGLFRAGMNAMGEVNRQLGWGGDC